MNIIMKSLGEITPYEKNAKKHDETQINNVAESIRQYGFVQPIVIDKEGVIVIGHCRALAAKKLGMDKVPCVCVDDLTPEQVDALRVVDNKTNESEWDYDILSEILPDIDLSDFDFAFDDMGIGADDDIIDNTDDIMLGEQGSLARDFIAPPLSVLNSQNGEWQKRKKEWRRRINDDGASRGGASDSLLSMQSIKGAGMKSFATVSLLDPVMAEILSYWFMPKPEHGVKCFDCFAGDTVFGYVSAARGKEFTGIEIRPEQAQYNQEQFDRAGLCARCICDDGRNVKKHIPENSQDFFFSCPPYYDLEVYSDLPNDASNQASYAEFYSILDDAFTKSVDCLKPNRFAVIVASDIRNKKHGGYYDFIPDIKKTFVNAGCILYNEMILLNPVGSAAMRARKNFAQRKVTRIHQEILVFYKGDPKEIKNLFGEIEVAEINESEDE